MNQFTNNNKLIDALDFRIKSIEDSKDILEKSLAGNKKENRKKYYFDVGYFVHTIWENYDLKILFEELLSYSSQLKQREEYSTALSNINKSIKSIATQMLSHANFTAFEKEYGNINWVNPFEHLPLLNIRTLLERLKDIDNNKLMHSYNNIYALFVNSDGLNGILNKFTRISETGYENIIKELNLFSDNLRILFFHEQFHYDYLGVNSAIQLQLIYRNVHPLFVPSEINEAMFNGFIKSGKDILEANNLLSHCKKIREYFKQKLNTKFSIEVSIQRFKQYMEVFYKSEDSKYSEDIFQKEFELFMFNNGYFALSQGKVGNGRYDNIILNENNAFLCEHKQIGFGRIKETKKKQIEKFQSSKIQAKIYHERLRLFPDLSNDIYIMLFSKYYLRFKDNISDIQIDGLNYKFKLICLEKVVPSKIKKIEEIDIAEIIQ